MARFKYEELLKTKTGLDNTPSQEEKKNLIQLLDFLNKVGAELDYPVIVNSGFRSVGVNKAVGGVDLSHHRLGWAADLTCKDVKNLLDHLKKYLDDIDQLIYYRKKNFVHISLHPNNRKQYFER